MTPFFVNNHISHNYSLMIPGPVEVEENVLQAMGSSIMADYDEEFIKVYKNIMEQMKNVFHTRGDVILMFSSGSGGIEAAIGSMFAPTEKVIVTINGFFGSRLSEIAKSHFLDVVPVLAPWGQPINGSAVRVAFENNPDIKGVIAIHHETSTGIKNPVAEIGSLCKEFRVPLILDAISSLGGEELLMDEWGVDVCIATCNKCLEAAPGIALVAVGDSAWEIMNQKSNLHSGWYLNLRVWKQYMAEWWDWHPAPVTIPTNNVLALQVALENLFNEGLDNRIEKYRNIATAFRTGLQNLNFELFADPVFASSTMTAVKRLPKMNVPNLINFLKKNYNIMIADGLGDTKGEIVRIGHMGKAANLSRIAILIEAFSSCLQNSS